MKSPKSMKMGKSMSNQSRTRPYVMPKTNKGLMQPNMAKIMKLSAKQAATKISSM